jgi:hypothetical protein
MNCLIAYNFMKIDSSLRTTPAMAAGVVGRLLGVSDLVSPGRLTLEDSQSVLRVDRLFRLRPRKHQNEAFGVLATFESHSPSYCVFDTGRSKQASPSAATRNVVVWVERGQLPAPVSRDLPYGQKSVHIACYTQLNRYAALTRLRLS